MMKFPKITFVSLLFFLLLYEPVKAENNQFVNVINPVRISKYTEDIGENLEVQYSVVSDYGLPATWLLTYDVLVNPGVRRVVESFNDEQELGVWLEVSPGFAEAAGVAYNDTGFWHHAKSVFLSGYSQEDRKQMIDTFFSKFKEVYGYYPKSVGAWWVDSYSLSYMQEKYGIAANLGVADQFSTDGYQVWGQYWSVPFYPSLYHTGMPASDVNNKLDVVNLQWAARDPVRGYYSSLYSTQDYFTTKEKLDIKYFEELVKTYAFARGNKFGQITVGLESDLSPEAYEGEYKKQMEVVAKYVSSGEVEALTMGEFSKWYRKSFPALSPVHVVSSSDFLGEPIMVYWYQSPYYRLGVRHNLDTKETVIFDFRSYYKNFYEPHYTSPNGEFDLKIYMPSFLDEVNNGDDVWQVNTGEYMGTDREGETLTLNFDKAELMLKPRKIGIQLASLNIPASLTFEPTIDVSASGNKINILTSNKWITDDAGYSFSALTDVATHTLERRRNNFLVTAALISIIISGLLVIRSKHPEKVKLILLTALISPPIIFAGFWVKRNSQEYFVSDAEVDVLRKLRTLGNGKVVVYNHECLGCSWHTPLKPAVYANKREYVKILSGKSVIYNSGVFESETREEAKEEFDKLNAEYVYIVRYEDYIEKVPFSPGDLGIERVYGDANAEIWKRTDK
jgi:hypothetical protein